jgi:hypothetical protein
MLTMLDGGMIGGCPMVRFWAPSLEEEFPTTERPSSKATPFVTESS